MIDRNQLTALYLAGRLDTRRRINYRAERGYELPAVFWTSENLALYGPYSRACVPRLHRPTVASYTDPPSFTQTEVAYYERVESHTMGLHKWRRVE